MAINANAAATTPSTSAPVIANEPPFPCERFGESEVVFVPDSGLLGGVVPGSCGVSPGFVGGTGGINGGNTGGNFGVVRGVLEVVDGVFGVVGAVGVVVGVGVSPGLWVLATITPGTGFGLSTAVWNGTATTNGFISR